MCTWAQWKWASNSRAVLKIVYSSNVNSVYCILKEFAGNFLKARNKRKLLQNEL